MTKLAMTGLLATRGKVKHFVAGKLPTRAQRVNNKKLKMSMIKHVKYKRNG